MWWTDWVKTLGSGFLGSLVGFLGVAWTLRHNRRWEVQKMNEQRQWEIEKMNEQRQWEIERSYRQEKISRESDIRKNVLKVTSLLWARNDVFSFKKYLFDEYVALATALLLEVNPIYPKIGSWIAYHHKIFSGSVIQKDNEKFNEVRIKIAIELNSWVSTSPLDNDYFKDDDWDKRLSELLKREV